jgi:hypothetical protein
MSEAPDDLRESLKAAFDGDEGGAAPAAPVEAVTAAPVAPPMARCATNTAGSPPRRG